MIHDLLDHGRCDCGRALRVPMCHKEKGRETHLWTTSWTAAKYIGLRIERSCCGGSGADDASAVLWSSSVSAPPSCLSDGVKIYIDLLRLRGVLLKGLPKSSKSGIYDHAYLLSGKLS